jgi:DNA-binding SARP family transcriptional activator
MENVATEEGHGLAAEVTQHRIRAQRSNGRESRPRAVESEVFESFPYGILVVDRSGTVLASNRAAANIVGQGHHSCELLGCRAPGPLAHVCLTEAALTRGGALPEIRLDLPAGNPTGAAWVTAAPLNADGSRVVIELRPGDAADRRRRSIPHWTAGAQLRIITLGATRVESAEGPIGGRWLEQRPGQLLKYLLAERHRVVRAEEIAETIWPGSGLKILGNVRHFVHALRTRLEPERGRRVPSSFILNVQGGYALDRRHVYIDADDFEDHVRAGLDHLADGHVALARERLEHAMSLYAGDFLADEPYADWAIPQRDLMRRLAADALRSLVSIARHDGDLDAAAAHLERLGDMEPFDTDVHRDILTLCLLRGRRSEALRRYAALRVRILRTFGEDIDFALADLRPNGQETAHAARTIG